MDYFCPQYTTTLPILPQRERSSLPAPPKAARSTTHSPPPRSAVASFALSFLLCALFPPPRSLSSFALSFLLRALFPPPRSPSSPSVPCFLSHFHPICPQHYRSSTIFPPITTVHPPKTTAPARQPAQSPFFCYNRTQVEIVFFGSQALPVPKQIANHACIFGDLPFSGRKLVVWHESKSHFLESVLAIYYFKPPSPIRAKKLNRKSHHYGLRFSFLPKQDSSRPN